MAAGTDVRGVSVAPSRGTSRWAAAVLAAVVLVQVAATALVLHPDLNPLSLPRPERWLPATALPYLIAVAALARTRLGPRLTAGIVLAVTAALQLIALTQPPQTSDDDLRYIWDGKVQLAGIDPYRYPPDALALAPLREPALFRLDGCTDPGGCALINRPSVNTVYPPVAQAAFVAVRLASFGGHGAHGGQLPFQLAAALGVLAVSALLVRGRLRAGTSVWPVAAWGWCPIVVSEFGNNAHVDWLAILFTCAALAACAASRPALTGLLAGAAVFTKLYPVLVLPVLLRRRPWVVLSAATAVGVLGYLPHVLAVGTKVIGYLPGYLDEEGYSSGSRLKLLGRVLPHPADTVVGLVILAALAWWCHRHTDPAHPERTAVGLVGAAFLVTTPNYGWYAAMLVFLIAMTGAWEWLPVAFAPTCTYLYGSLLFGHKPDGDSLIYLLAALAAMAIWLVRVRWQDHRTCPLPD